MSDVPIITKVRLLDFLLFQVEQCMPYQGNMNNYNQEKILGFSNLLVLLEYLVWRYPIFLLVSYPITQFESCTVQ